MTPQLVEYSGSTIWSGPFSDAKSRRIGCTNKLCRWKDFFIEIKKNIDLSPPARFAPPVNYFFMVKRTAIKRNYCASIIGLRLVMKSSCSYLRGARPWESIVPDFDLLDFNLIIPHVREYLLRLNYHFVDCWIETWKAVRYLCKRKVSKQPSCSWLFHSKY